MMEIDEILQQIHARMSDGRIKYIVFDDDPTGTQCSNDVYVYLKWNKEVIHELFQDAEHSAAFILTNSRSLSVKDTIALHTELGRAIAEESAASGIPFQILSRSDSTLRWNYPSEVDALRNALQEMHVFAGPEIICPCFIESGRITRNNIHYACVDGTWVPVGETEFAKDKTFGYHASNLLAYIREKRNTYIPDEKFICIKETDLEEQAASVFDQLCQAKEDQILIVNATTAGQLAFFALQYVQASLQGKHFLYRGGSSMIRFLMNQPYVPFLSKEDLQMRNSSNGGLIVAGSHVAKTTRQLKALETAGISEAVIFHQAVLLKEEADIAQERYRCIQEIDTLLRQKKTVCYMTDRTRIDLPQQDEAAQLAFSLKISDAFLSVVKSLHACPSFVIGKGGITSCLLGELIMRKERVLVQGQIASGISVWRGEPDALFPKTPYIVFPGNVGDDQTLYEVVRKMLSEEHQ